MYRPPVIIVGMHRSGTTMITKMLENLGLFVGAEKEVNNEALFFWEINNWIFELHTANAEKPYNMRYTNPACRKVIVESLAYFLSSSRRKKYLGKHSATVARIQDTPFPYGWKDPKNTFTVDFWKELFPEAKIVHIYRNPIDSISSYIERDLALKNKFVWNWKKKLKREFLISKNFHPNFRIYNLEEGFQAWQAYMDKALSLKNSCSNYIEVRYEDFLKNPTLHLSELSNFCGLQPSQESIEQETKNVKTDRAFAFLNRPEYVAFYQQIKDHALMQQLGYHQL